MKGTDNMKRIIQFARSFINRIQRWWFAVEVEGYLKENIVHLKLRRYYPFKIHEKGYTLYDIEIDPTLSAQSKPISLWQQSALHHTLMQRIRIFANQIHLWRGVWIVDWRREGTSIHLTIRRLGLFKMYAGKPIYCDIDIA